MEKLPDRQAEVNRYIWNMYHRPPLSKKTKLLLGVLGVVFLTIIFGFQELLRIAVIMFLAAIVAGVGFWIGFDYGKYRGETNERKQMLDEGYSLGGQDRPDAENDDVKPLRTCKWCGHIQDDGDS